MARLGSDRPKRLGAGKNDLKLPNYKSIVIEAIEEDQNNLKPQSFDREFLLFSFFYLETKIEINLRNLLFFVNQKENSSILE